MADIDPNDPSLVIKATKTKISKVMEAGFRCSVCEVETVTHDGSNPVACLNCHAPNPKLVWKNIITHQLTVKTVDINLK